MPLADYSNFSIAQKNANKYFANFKRKVELRESTRKDKKYMIHNGQKWIHFGQMGYADFTKHRDAKRRASYLRRSAAISGNWADDPFSPNNLSRNILW